MSLNVVGDECEVEYFDMSQELIGAWQSSITTPDQGEMKAVMIMADGYLSTSVFDPDRKLFYGTTGGAYKIVGNTISQTVEFDTRDSTRVGQTIVLPFSLMDNKLLLGAEKISWSRIDYGTPGALAGPWLITGRKRNGEISSRIPGARKTMKILSGTRFQWIAYNTDTGEFFGTGGGTYTTVNGKYIENIDFFSRDGSRVGAKLEFDYTLELEKGEWHHSGLSSKGSPIYEVWTLRSILDK